MARHCSARRRPLSVVATLLVAFTLALTSPSPAQQENILNVGKYTQLGSYDPHAGAFDTLWWTGNNFYESLLDLNEDLSGPRPVLATSWTASKDGKIYTRSEEHTSELQSRSD